MKIIMENNVRILVKDNNDTININNGKIIKYTGIYYKKKSQKIIDYDEIQTKFIGIIETERYRYDEGIMGIYVKPLYIEMDEWHKVINYKEPKKYFFYPHLLMLPEKYYHFHPLYFLDTCENVLLEDFNHITKTFILDEII